MNALSWLLYAAETVDKVSVVSSLIGLFTSLISIVFFFITRIPRYAWDDNLARNGDAPGVTAYDMLHNSFKGLFVIAIIFTAIWFVVPSRNTVIQIVASEFVGTVSQMEDIQQIGGEVGDIVKDSLSLLKQTIGEQLKPEVVEETK